MFLESTAARYAREGDELLRATLDPFAYARHCETRLREEAAMCDDALDAATTRRAVAVVARCLVEKHLQGLLDDAFTKAFGENKTDELARFYTLGGQRRRRRWRRATTYRNDLFPERASTTSAATATAADGCAKFVDAVRRAFGSSLRELGMDIVKDETGEKTWYLAAGAQGGGRRGRARAFDGGEAFAATARGV